ncbi:MAG: SGNH/GDSL hydrolase family protein [Prevotella sp.]
MMKQLLTIAFLLMPAFASAADKQVKASDKNISFVGRTETLPDGGVRYDWVGTYMKTRFTGGRIGVVVSETGTSYYNIIIDGKVTKKIKITGKEPQTIMLVEKMSKGEHELMLQKCTEGEYGCTTIHALVVDNSATLSPVEPKKRLIEAYGDSYTCGYGTEGQSAKERFKLETENCNKAYACIIARYFDADYRLIAHSGFGMVRNWGDKKQRSDDNLSTRYTQTYDQFASTPFDYNQRRPDIVTINLGTNDFSPTAIPEAKDYVEAYIKMIETISARYDNVPILCITPHSSNEYLRAAIKLLKERTANRYANVHFANPMNNIVNDNVDLGSDWHPNYQGQRKIAMTLIPQISKIMNWEVK